MRSSINKNLIFIEINSSFSLDSLVKNFGKDLRYLRQEFDSKVLDLVKQKIFYPLTIWVVLESLKKDCLVKKYFLVSGQVRK